MNKHFMQTPSVPNFNNIYSVILDLKYVDIPYMCLVLVPCIKRHTKP